MVLRTHHINLDGHQLYLLQPADMDAMLDWYIDEGAQLVSAAACPVRLPRASTPMFECTALDADHLADGEPGTD